MYWIRRLFVPLSSILVAFSQEMSFIDFGLFFIKKKKKKKKRTKESWSNSVLTYGCFV